MYPKEPKYHNKLYLSSSTSKIHEFLLILHLKVSKIWMLIKIFRSLYISWTQSMYA